MPYITREKLPTKLQSIVKLSVNVIVADEVSIPIDGWTGKRKVFALLAPDGGTVTMRVGPFGGENIFGDSELKRYHDEHDGRVAVPEDGYAASWYQGEHVTTIYARAHVVARLLGLDAADVEVIRDASIEGASRGAEALAELAPAAPKVRNLDRWVLYVYKSIKSGYREDALREIARRVAGNAGLPTAGSLGVVHDAVEACLAAGWLKRNRAGATSITIEGKNLAKEHPYGESLVETWSVSS